MEDDGDDKDGTKRITRNLTEKKRRDQFNSLVTELSNLISTNNRKMDKSTVLKSTISFLKNHNEVTVQSRVHDVQEDWKPSFLSNEEFTHLALEALEGFIMVFSTSGRIHYASESVSSLLGHNAADLVNKNIFNMIHDNDYQTLYNAIVGNASNEQTDKKFKEDEMITFEAHIQRGSLSITDEVSYDAVRFYGHLRKNPEQDFENVESSSRMVFVCIGCLCTPKLIRDVSFVDATCNEFTSRHSLEWKFLFLDHRAPPIIGYLPFEVLGTSGYDYYHFDDLEKITACHEALIQKGELTSCYYRFLTKGQQWIWLQTRYYITFHQWNSKPEFVVCTHRAVSYAEVIKTKEEMTEQEADLSDSENIESMKEIPGGANDNTAVMTPPSTVSEDKSEVLTSAFKPFPQNLRKLYTLFEVMNAFLKIVTPNDFKKQTKRVLPPSPWSNLTLPTLIPVPKDEDPAPVPMTPVPKTQVRQPEPSRPERPTSSLPALVLDASDPLIKSESVKSAPAAATGTGGATQAAVTAADTWTCTQPQYTGGSETPAPAEPRSSQRNSEQEDCVPQLQAPLRPESPQTFQPSKQDYLAGLQLVGTEFVNSGLFVGGVILPGSASASQTQAQIQLHRKHEELQQMIVRQQEELRLMKEQLLLARLGIMQPDINVPANSYSTTQQELQSEERLPNMTYTMAGSRPAAPVYSGQGSLPQLTSPSILAQPQQLPSAPILAPLPQQPHPDNQHMPQ